MPRSGPGYIVGEKVYLEESDKVKQRGRRRNIEGGDNHRGGMFLSGGPMNRQ